MTAEDGPVAVGGALRRWHTYRRRRHHPPRSRGQSLWLFRRQRRQRL